MYDKLRSDEGKDVDILDTLPESTRILNNKVETDLDESDEDLYFEDID